MLPGPPTSPTSELLVGQALFVAQQEGQEVVQPGCGPPGDDVEEDGPVEDLEDGRGVRGGPLGAGALPPREGPQEKTGSAWLERNSPGSPFPHSLALFRRAQHSLQDPLAPPLVLAGGVAAGAVVKEGVHGGLLGPRHHG